MRGYLGRPPSDGTTHADRVLIRELFSPSDGSIPLTAREIGEKFELSMRQVYRIVHMTDTQMLRAKVRKPLERKRPTNGGVI
jgi:hypothetical protein